MEDNHVTYPFCWRDSIILSISSVAFLCKARRILQGAPTWEIQFYFNLMCTVSANLRVPAKKTSPISFRSYSSISVKRKWYVLWWIFSNSSYSIFATDPVLYKHIKHNPSLYSHCVQKSLVYLPQPQSTKRINPNQWTRYFSVQFINWFHLSNVNAIKIIRFLNSVYFLGECICFCL